jgi:DnaJ-like protein
MTERKPAGLSFESWIDKQIREATERGEFDNLPGAGKPLPDRNEPYNSEWWLRDYLRREGAPLDELLPTPLRLRKAIQQLPETVRALPTEQSVRDAVANINDQVRAWWRSSVGPQVHVGLADVEQIVAGWRAGRPTAPEPAGAPDPAPRRRWWRRDR